MKQQPKKSAPPGPARRGEKRAITIICAILAAIMLGLAGYAVGWYATRARIQGDMERYRAMYNPAPAATATAAEPAPTPTSEPVATLAPLETTPPARTEAALSDLPTAAPDVTAEPIVVDQLLPTPDPETKVYALPTAPPAQTAFGELLSHNPDTVGYLDIEGFLSLPVVQRENDNEYYLTHNFDQEESIEGALFLDGVNRLTPEDDCLIVYGHNMKNGTMFGDLEDYEGLKFLKAHPLVHFDTLYENRVYVPIAAFTASMNPEERHYFDVRQFVFDETEFELFTLKMQARSAREYPVEARYGDRLLLLVTCDYTNKQGRFILALRQLRPGETEDDMRRLFQKMA